MKILFINGTIEKGKDGVGDYTTRLAFELVRSGHHSSIIAINDKFAKEIVKGIQTESGFDIAVLRLPTLLNVKHKIAAAKQFIDDLDPDWISIQYVPFSFHKKGLPFNLGKRLEQLGKGKRFHVMFHELWVGMEVNSPIKEAFWGRLQQLIIMRMLRLIKPHLIHTHTALYQHKLKDKGVKSLHLPLFSNIPLIKIEHETLIPTQISIAVFGNIHHGALINKFLISSLNFQKESDIKIKLVFIGRNGHVLDSWLKECSLFGIQTEVKGEQSAEAISLILQQCQAGFSTTPLLLAEKSGVVAAMREHKLKIINVGRDWRSHDSENIKIPKDIVEIDEFFINALKISKCSESKFGLPHVTHLFIKDLIDS